MQSLRAALCTAFLAVLVGCGGSAPSSVFNEAGYYVRGETVYYLKAFPGDAFEIEQADAATFEVLDETYALDEHTVYLNGFPLTGADPASFEVLEEPGYSRDAEHVFLREGVLTTDVARFAFLPDGGLTKDGAHVYWSDGSVLSDDPAHFAILSHDEGYLFTKDSSDVHVNGNPIEGADPTTFEVYGGAYATDADAVFYFATAVPGADAATFEVLEAPYARDAGHAFWMGKVIPDADPASFVVLNADFECAADATRGFYRDLLIDDFDPDAIPRGATVTGCSETAVNFS